MTGMAEPAEESLETRVRSLEGEVARIRERLALSGADAAAARVLASGADRDVTEVRAELRAHAQVLNSLREDQLALRAEMGEFRDETRQEFAVVNARMTRIVKLLESTTGRWREPAEALGG